MKTGIYLTLKEREALDLIKSTPGGELRPYRNPSKTFCYRLINNRHSPITNIKARIIEVLYNADILIKKDGYFCLKNPK